MTENTAVQNNPRSAVLTIVKNQLVAHYLTILRDKRTQMRDFYNATIALTAILAQEVAGVLSAQTLEIDTPMCEYEGIQIAGAVALVPVLSAAEAMVHSFISVIPTVGHVYHVGVYRDEQDNSRPKPYKHWIPNECNPTTLFLLLDPMLATGGSANYAISLLKAHGAVRIVYAGIVAAPEGVMAVQEAHPDVSIFTCALDDRLNDDNYIVPGLGDFGDRVWGR